MLQKFFGSSDKEKKLQPGEWELIGTRFFGEEDFENVSPWVRQQIKKICDKGLGESPEELTHEFVGRTFTYRLDFDGPNGEILGVYRKLKDKSASHQNAQHKKQKRPSWQRIYLGGYGVPTYGKAGNYFWNKNVPSWVRKKIQHMEGNRIYYLQGKRYRYKVKLLDWGHGNSRIEVYRKPRTWYWKRLNG